jgi:tetratricopeptide (TPR) repeat protein
MNSVIGLTDAEYPYSNQTIADLITTAETAAYQCDHKTAIAHYRRVIELLPAKPMEQPDSFFRVRLGLGRSLKYVGEFAASQQILTETLWFLLNWRAVAEPGVVTPLLVECLRQLGDVHQREGAYDQAMALLRQGLELLSPDGAQYYPSLWYSLLDRIAWVRFRQGQLAEAVQLVHSVVSQVTPDTFDALRLASLYNTLGGIAWQQGKREEAITYVESSLQLYESRGHLWGQAVACGNLGVLYDVTGNWPKAAEYHKQAYLIQYQIGDLAGQARSLNNLGFLYLVMGNHDAADENLLAGLEIARQIGDQWIIAQSQASLAQLYSIRGQWPKAEEYSQAALILSQTIGSQEIEIQACWIMALVKAEKAEALAGLSLTKQALAMARQAGLMEGEIDCLIVSGALYRRTGQHQVGEAQLQEALGLAVAQNDPYRHGLVLLELGRLYQELSWLDKSHRGAWHAKAEDALYKASHCFESLSATHALSLVQKMLKYR